MATMVRQIDAEIENLQYEFITLTKILVKGEIAKQIFYVSNTDVVRHQKVRTPFTVSFEVIGLRPGSQVTVNASIVHISPRLMNNGSQVEESIIAKITVTPTCGGAGVSQQFLIRNIDTLEEPLPVTQPVTSPPAAPVCEIESPTLESPITASPSIPNGLEEVLRQLEDQLRFEIEHSLRWELRSQMEHELQQRLAEERLRQEEDARRAEKERRAEAARRHHTFLKESIRQSLHGFKAKN